MQQKEFFLPKILAGDIHFAIGYSEPGAGTDLANLRTRAVRDGDDYVINGSKLWTSLAATSDYCWLAVRTDPDAKKHRGLSIICVPMDTPGISHDAAAAGRREPDLRRCTTTTSASRPTCSSAARTTAGGSSPASSTPSASRCAAPAWATSRCNEVIDWAKETLLPDGRRVIDQPWVQTNLAKAYAGFEFLRLINWKVAWQATQDIIDVADASTTKVFGTEHYLDSVRLLMEIIGEPAYLKEGSPGAVLASRLESMYRGVVILTFGGGVNEVQRDLIAAFGLGMPLAKR